jgi:hypothetical protein
MNGDKQLLRGRVYGHDHDDPEPGPRLGRTYAELVGGPLDGLLLDIHGPCVESRMRSSAPWPAASPRYAARCLSHRPGRRRRPVAPRPRHPAVQRPRVDAQIPSHFRNRLPGLRHDPHRPPRAELGVVDALPGCHDPNYPSGHGLRSRRGTSRVTLGTTWVRRCGHRRAILIVASRNLLWRSRASHWGDRRRLQVNPDG